MALIFGAGWVFAKSALGHFPPILLAAFRFGIAGVFVLAIAPAPQISMAKLILVSILAISIPYSLSNFALSKLDVSLTVLLSQLEAPVLIIFGLVFLRERPTRRTIIGVVVAIVGVVLVAGRPAFNGGLTSIIGMMASIVVWATGQILIRKSQLAQSFGLLGLLSLAATPQLLVLSWIYEKSQYLAIESATALHWVQVVYLGLVMTALGIGTWYFLIARYPVALVAPFLLLVPVVSLLGGVFILGESLSYLTFLGGAVVLTGVGLCTLQGPFKRNSGGERMLAKHIAEIKN